MDRSEVIKIVDRSIDPLLRRFGIEHWKVEVCYDLRADNGIAHNSARCTRMADYNRAIIEFDPDQFDDEASVLRSLRHELFHVLLSPFDVYSNAAEAALHDSATTAILARVWSHSVEQAVINLERLYDGLTGVIE